MTEMMRNIVKMLLLWLTMLHLMMPHIFAQSIKAKLEFQTDTVQIGQVVAVKMVIEHPAEVILVFPESRDFAPFELVSREPEPTQTINGVSWDVVTYQVRSFSLATKQAIRLPYSFYGRRDTIQRFVSTDSIYMSLVTPEDISGLEYQSHDGMISMVDPPNYLGIGILVAAIFVVMAIAGFFLRKPLEKYLAIRKTDLEWRAVKKQLKRMENLPDQIKLFDQLNQLWKAYLDPDDSIGLRSMTTTEIRREIIKFSDYSMNQQQVLINTSRTADQVIYAGKTLRLAEVLEILENIKKVLGSTYLRRKKQVKKEGKR